MKGHIINTLTTKKLIEQLEIDRPEVNHIMLCGLDTLHTTNLYDAINYIENHTLGWGMIKYTDNEGWIELIKPSPQRNKGVWKEYKSPGLAMWPISWKNKKLERKDKEASQTREPELVKHYKSADKDWVKINDHTLVNKPSLILLDKEGEDYLMQVGGVGCHQATAKGKILPLEYYDSWVFNPDIWYACNPQNKDDGEVIIAEIKRVLTNQPTLEIELCKRYGGSFPGELVTKLASDPIEDLTEAWVPVHIYLKGEFQEAILTWENCD